jgi:hypothetical protein
MTVHDVVITLLLVFPWGLVGVALTGTALEHVRKARRVRGREASVPFPLQRQREATPMSCLSEDDARAHQANGRLRKAA